jgi:hypothetical protein
LCLKDKIPYKKQFFKYSLIFSKKIIFQMRGNFSGANAKNFQKTSFPVLTNYFSGVKVIVEK